MATNYLTNPNDLVTKLNNFLQARGRLNKLTWKEAATGTADSPQWTVKACIVTRLNNYLQARGLLSCLTWKKTATGSNYNLEWTVIAFIDGAEYGYSTHPTEQGAQQEAAQKALSTLEMVDEYAPR
ncbi:unnamed protein product [Rhizoctonia solani]|uniref:DRBM domain-containing protein n=1 Tax=Rhizoctonia solani TaxID=456999 RepID=A0A8H3DXH7_9AGAM|nr:unnamed protein product [Rhizoctonia solani]